MFKLQTSKADIISEGEAFVNWDREMEPPENFFKDMKDIRDIRQVARALDSFQIRRTFHIGGGSFTNALVALRARMPQIIQDKAMLSLGFQAADFGEPRGAYPGQHGYFSWSDEDFEERIGNEQEPLMINKEYIMWTVNTGDSVLRVPFDEPPSPPKRQHYVTIAMHLEPTDPDNKPDVRDRVTHLAIADPLHQQHANKEESKRFKDRIIYRLKRYMSKFTFAPDCERDLWTPPLEQDLVEENFATPYMAYSVTSQLYDRIAEMEFSGSGFDPEVFFRPTLPYFDPDRVRTEIWGLLIAKYMDLMDWKVRIGMVPTSYAVDPQIGGPTSPASLKFSEKLPIGYNWKDFVDAPSTPKAGQDTTTKEDDAGGEEIDDLFGDNPAASPAAEKMDIDIDDAEAEADADADATVVTQAEKAEEDPVEEDPAEPAATTTTTTTTATSEKDNPSAHAGSPSSPKQTGTQTDDKDNAAAATATKPPTTISNSDGDCCCRCPARSEQERQRRLEFYIKRKNYELLRARYSANQAAELVAAAVSTANTSATVVDEEDDNLERHLDALRAALLEASAAVADAEADARRVGDVPGGDLEADRRARDAASVGAAAAAIWEDVVAARGRLAGARVALRRLERRALAEAALLAGCETVGKIYADKRKEREEKEKGKGKGGGEEVETETDDEDDEDDEGTYYDPKEIITADVPPYHI
ncbi:hypothetical protein F4809DRAFT_664289 [Biscogniauxia mediterranea]|nr:hypothetical protein F4809DRAFT_664289 [Biscogniauxia mediterranea]